MRDRIWIFASLAVFATVLTAPIWYARVVTKPAAKPPNLVLPANQRECVAPAGTMRATHVQILVNWREDVVRRGERRYVAYDGSVYEKSLTHTCLGCHNKAEFCDRCHAYSGISALTCWNCHNEPQTAIARSAP
jgi:hypothetical protein